MGKFERLFMFVVGLWFLANVGLGIHHGKYEILRSGKTIERTSEPEKFWGVLVAQTSMGLLFVFLAIPGFPMVIGRKNRKGSIQTLDAHKAEIEVLIAYGKSKQALERVNSLLLRYPEDKSLMVIKQKILTNR